MREKKERIICCEDCQYLHYDKFGGGYCYKLNKELNTRLVCDQFETKRGYKVATFSDVKTALNKLGFKYTTQRDEFVLVKTKKGTIRFDCMCGLEPVIEINFQGVCIPFCTCVEVYKTLHGNIEIWAGKSKSAVARLIETPNEVEK